ncbi:hypothetical protein [Pseudonocardia dioxanivorans]|jgi:hypothetical protein|uniref:Uncharacterized protein n=1 Tax=Pseudonocardia dioxanivorans (strain ATCC 55486 / DSM 44775 / JCM 13855 / CB1190) TaxID=675635 RepID=F2L789_PSEUX|nr:hypothetical protein [Pseudonocardia dioxanivorans]AEA29062.1 hypothetical protein Psed_7005 [Pseudonocardia dioxanivorans CB1190]
MSGHRRTLANGAALPLTQRKSRLARRRASLAARYAAAATPIERAHAAWAYLLGAAARRQPDQRVADELLDDVARTLIRVGDQLLQLQAREPLHPDRRQS